MVNVAEHSLNDEHAKVVVAEVFNIQYQAPRCEILRPELSRFMEITTGTHSA